MNPAGDNRDFITRYVAFQGPTESAAVYHRWCAISMIAAIVGRRAFMSFGHTVMYPNMYTLLLGKPGDRKSSAIKAAKAMAASAGFTKFAATRTTREAFLLDLEGLHADGGAVEQDQLLEFLDPNAPKEVYIVADEFDEFIGLNNVNFVRLLGVLWDYDEEIPYRDRVKNSKSVSIKDPTVNILGGTTPTNFAMAFPPEILGQGFFSRLLLVHGERNSNRNTLGAPQDMDEKLALIQQLQEISCTCAGSITHTPGAFEILDTIYKNPEPFTIADSRFESYQNRRFTHLLKLAMVTALAAGVRCIDTQHVIYANTMLAYTEKFMPRALGEFGKSKHSEISNKIMEKLYASDGIVTHMELFAALSTDLGNINELVSLVQALEYSGKLQIVKTDVAVGYIPKQRPFSGNLPFVDWSLLSTQEREYTK